MAPPNNCRDAPLRSRIVGDVEDALHFDLAARFDHAREVDCRNGPTRPASERPRSAGTGTSSRSASAKVAALSKQHSRLAADGRAANSGRYAATVATACAPTGMNHVETSPAGSASSSGTRRIKPSR